MVNDGKQLKAYRVALEAWTESLLNEYTQWQAKRQSVRVYAKEFNDPIWGTVKLHAHEIVVLDSPLLQRLRNIRQLGVVHFVYPGATHSRLEHSLGTLTQVHRLVDSLRSRGIIQDPEIPPLTEGDELLLRMAALCHDVGHGFMSHVSEYALESEDSCRAIRRQFQREFDLSPENQLSEIAAYYIMGSAAFRELIEVAFRRSAMTAPADFVDRMQRAIIGQQIDERKLQMHQFISGPIDADKLDYLTRDAKMCGVPVLVDGPRIVEKVRASRIDTDGLPPALKKNVQHSSHYLITGIAVSGARSLDELALARTLMFDKVYRHQKVRAAESMVAAVTSQLARLCELLPTPAMLPLHIEDDEVLRLDRRAILQLAGLSEGSLDQQQEAAVAVIQDIAGNLRARRLWVRALAFSSTMPDDEFMQHPDHVEGLRRFVGDMKNPPARKSFVAILAKEVVAACSGLRRLPLLNVPGGDLLPFIWVSPPKSAPRSATHDIGHACLIDEYGTVAMASDYAAADTTMAWSDAYVNPRDLGHIFCPESLAMYVHVAAEKVMRTQYGIRLPKSMVAYSKQDRTELEKLKRGLKRLGWYEGCPQDIQPIPTVLLAADARDRLQEVARNLAGYSGPWGTPTASGFARKSTISSARVREFVIQYPEHLVDPALTVCSAIRVIERSDARRAVANFIEEHPEFAQSSFTALGTFKDSSSVVTYHVGDFSAEGDYEILSLTEAIGRDKPIIFVDDFIGLGSQSIDILESWLGADRTAELHEERGDQLAGPFVDAFRSRQLGFVFIAGLREGPERLSARLGELGLSGSVYVHIKESEIPTVGGVLEHHDLHDEFMEFSASVAERMHRADGRPDEWIEARKLGYGNRGLLLASTYNTPTATLTSIWKSGVDWEALLPRRRKR